MSESHDTPPKPAPPPGTDGWVEERYRPTSSLGETFGAMISPADREITDEEKAARSRATAILCHMSVLFGVPIFLAPFFKRDDPFVLHHAKASAVIFLVFYSTLLAALLGSGWFFALTLSAYIPGIICIWRASGGEAAGMTGLGGVGEMLFFPLKPRASALGDDYAQPLLDGATDEESAPKRLPYAPQDGN